MADGGKTDTLVAELMHLNLDLSLPWLNWLQHMLAAAWFMAMGRVIWTNPTLLRTAADRSREDHISYYQIFYTGLNADMRSNSSARG